MRAEIAAEAVAAGLEELGEAATYLPPGAGAPAVECTVILTLGERPVDIGEARLIRAARIVKVRASEVTAPAIGGVFAVAGEGLRIFAEPRREDPQRLVWTCEVAGVAADAP